METNHLASDVEVGEILGEGGDGVGGGVRGGGVMGVAGGGGGEDGEFGAEELEEGVAHLESIPFFADSIFLVQL